MYKRQLRKLGGSTAVIVPPAALDALHLRAGSRVVIAVEGDLITLKATTDRPRYTEVELLAQCDPDAQMSEEDRQWFADKPVGAEVI